MMYEINPAIVYQINVSPQLTLIQLYISNAGDWHGRFAERIRIIPAFRALLVTRTTVDRSVYRNTSHYITTDLYFQCTYARGIAGEAAIVRIIILLYGRVAV